MAWADETGSELDRVMAGLRAVKSSAAHFTERKEVAMLTRPVESAGSLRYTAPDRLEMITREPAPETMLVSGGTLSGTRGDGDRYHVALDEHPEIATLVEAVRSTLSGNLPVLRRYYEVGFAGTEAGGWQLDLHPLGDAVRDRIVEIRIAGIAARLNTVDVLEADGDRSAMTITPDGP